MHVENEDATQALLSSGRAQRMKRACTLRIPDLSAEDKYSDSNSSDEDHKPAKKAKTSPYPHTNTDPYPGLPDATGMRSMSIANPPVSTELIEENIILDEENAVILLSTAFQTIPYSLGHREILVNSSAYTPECTDLSDDEFNQAKRRGAYPTFLVCVCKFSICCFPISADRPPQGDVLSMVVDVLSTVFTLYGISLYHIWGNL